MIRFHFLYISFGVILISVILLLVTAKMSLIFIKWYRKRKLKEKVRENFARRAMAKQKLGLVEYILSYDYTSAKLTIEVLQVNDLKFPGTLTSFEVLTRGSKCVFCFNSVTNYT